MDHVIYDTLPVMDHVIYDTLHVPVMDHVIYDTLPVMDHVIYDAPIPMDHVICYPSCTCRTSCKLRFAACQHPEILVYKEIPN